MLYFRHMHEERGGIGDLLIIFFGIALLLFVIGFFNSDRTFWNSFNYKTILRLPCGLTVNDPKSGATVVFPLAVDGYINGCDWDPSGASAGTAQIITGTGLPVTAPFILVIPQGSTEAPYSFAAHLVLETPPDDDKGYVLIKSTTGIISTIPIAF